MTVLIVIVYLIAFVMCISPIAFSLVENKKEYYWYILNVGIGAVFTTGALVAISELI